MHTLIRVLSTSEAFRGQCDCDEDQPVEDTPFDPMTTEGLFSALYFLSEGAEMVAGVLLDKLGAQARSTHTLRLHDAGFVAYPLDVDQPHHRYAMHGMCRKPISVCESVNQSFLMALRHE